MNNHYKWLKFVCLPVIIINDGNLNLVTSNQYKWPDFFFYLPVTIVRGSKFILVTTNYY